MPTANQQRQRSRVTNAASKKKSPNSQRGYKATRNNSNALHISLRERPSLWIAEELDGGRSRRDGIWLAPSMNTDQVTFGLISRNLHGRYRMTPSDSLPYVIKFRDSSNCSRIQNAQPGEEIVVLVHPEQEPLADTLAAKGTRSQDGTVFVVEITTADGAPQSFDWEYPLLKLVARILQPSHSRVQSIRAM